MTRIKTRGSVELNSGAGVKLNFNANIITSDKVVGEMLRARLVIKEAKNINISDIDSCIYETAEQMCSKDNLFTFLLPPEETIKLKSKIKYYLTLQVSVPDMKLATEATYDLVITDSVVKSLL